MIDAYTHLDLAAADPAADLRQRLSLAGAGGALVVETWDGRNRAAFEAMLGEPGIAGAVCLRGPALPVLPPGVVAVRVKTLHLDGETAWLDALEASGCRLLAHAENGIAPLARRLARVAAARPHLAIYVPHLGWPRADDPSWPGAMERLAELSNVTLGVSALAWATAEPFPHDDVRARVAPLIERFGPRRLLAGTDYPLIDKPRYAAYLALARDWITAAWPSWSDSDALSFA